MEKLDTMSVNKIVNAIGIHLEGNHIGAVLSNDFELIKTVAAVIKELEEVVIPEVKSKVIEETLLDIMNKFPERINKRALLVLSIYDMQVALEEKREKLSEKQVTLLKKCIAKGMKILERENFDVVNTIRDAKNINVTKIEVINSIELYNCIKKGIKVSTLARRDAEKDARIATIDQRVGVAQLLQVIDVWDIEHTITSNEEIGNAVVEQLSTKAVTRYLEENPEDEEILKGADTIPKEIEEKIRRSVHYGTALEEGIKENIKYIDIDKMLLVAGLRYIEILERATQPIILDAYAENGELREQTPEESARIMKGIIMSIAREVREGTIIIGMDGKEHTLEELQKDIRRFVGTKYIKKAEVEQLKEKLFTGEITLEDIGKEKLSLLDLTGQEIFSLIAKSERNLIFLLENRIIDEKSEMLRALYLRNECSDELFEKIIQKQLLDGAQISCLFEDGIIKLEQISKIKDRKMIEDMQIPLRIKEIYIENLINGENLKQEQIELFNKYSRLYRTVMIEGRTEEEVQENTFRLISAFEDELSNDILKELYQFGLISLDSAIDWGVSPMEMLAENSMKPTDLKGLYAKKVIDIEAIKNVLVHGDLPYDEKLDLIYSTFDGETEEEYRMREELVQLLEPADEYKSNSKETTNNQNRGEGKKSREYVTDPHARWKLTSLIDKDYSRKFLPRAIEVRDGHSITLLPNHDKVMIEKMYDKRKGKVVNAYKKRTWIVPSEEFFKHIDEIIVDGAINRRYLGELWREGTVDGIIHSTAWGRKIKEYFDISEANTKYTKADIEEIDKAIEMVNKSRRERE